MGKIPDIINIAFLIDTISCDTAGTQKQLLEVIRRLNRQRFRPLLICLWKSAWMDQNKLPCAHIVLDYNGFLKLSFPGVVRATGSYDRRKADPYPADLF